jgi:CheY-like chemotaxis protein
MPARILVVDDYPVNVILLAEWLAREHYVVSTAADGLQALTIIEAEEPDIVLLDVMMPELDGFEVCKRIKSDPATEHIPVIMVTALVDVDDLVRGFEDSEMARNPVVLIHGYSDEGKSFRVWRDALRQRGYAVEELPICNYQSLTNEITIKDIAEGFDRAIKTHPRIDKDQPFDAIVHSTGMLVLRSWLATNPIGRKRLKHLIGLAPATFGSPLAQ